ncbi:hypothetical protein CVU75_01605, partial [Candidatus Dependentiae bacterium HGW-Dependentiae-1]
MKKYTLIKPLASLGALFTLILLVILIPACKKTPTEVAGLALLEPLHAHDDANEATKRNRFFKRAYRTHDTIINAYAQELDMIKNLQSCKEPAAITKKLKELILVKHDQFNKARRKKTLKLNPFKNVPFIRYKTALDQSALSLEKQRDLLNKRYPKRMAQLNEHINALLTQM